MSWIVLAICVIMLAWVLRAGISADPREQQEGEGSR